MNAAEKERKTRILVARRGDAAFVRVVGNASFRDCPALRTFTDRMREEGVRSFHFLLEECTGMDSTFLGSLAGLRFRTRSPEGVVIHSPGARVRELLATLGLDRLLRFADPDDPAGREPLDSLPPARPDKEELRGLMREAHQDLVRVSPENAARFQNVVDYLNRPRRGSAADGETQP